MCSVVGGWAREIHRVTMICQVKRHDGGVFGLLWCHMGSIYMQGSWGSCYEGGKGRGYLILGRPSLASVTELESVLGHDGL